MFDQISTVERGESCRRMRSVDLSLAVGAARISTDTLSAYMVICEPLNRWNVKPPKISL